MKILNSLTTHQRALDKRNRDRPSPTPMSPRRLTLPHRTAFQPHGDTPGAQFRAEYGDVGRRPSGTARSYLRQVPSGLDETLRIERDTANSNQPVFASARHQDTCIKVLTRYRVRAVAPPQRPTLKMCGFPKTRSSVPVFGPVIVGSPPPMRRIRYRDLLAAKLLERTSRELVLTVLRQVKSAAWPAEFAPPSHYDVHRLRTAALPLKSRL